MCHPDNQEYMPMGKTWGIMPSSGRRLSSLNFVIIYVMCWPNRPFFAARDYTEVTLEQQSFLENIFKIELAKRTWAKLVTLDTIH